MPIQKPTVKYFTSALLMVKVDLLSIPSFAPMELCSTKIISSVIGGSTSIALKQKPYIPSMTILQQSGKQIRQMLVLQRSLKHRMVLLLNKPLLKITNMMTRMIMIRPRQLKILKQPIKKSLKKSLMNKHHRHKAMQDLDKSNRHH